MSEVSNREKALRMAVDLETCRAKEDAQYDVVATATSFLNFLDGTTPAAPAAVAADPTPAAMRKPRAPKPTPANTAEGSESAPAAAGSAPNTSPAPGVAQPAEPTKAAVTPGEGKPTTSKAPTLDDVRTALVQCQTRKGGKDVPQAILNKYSPSKTTGGLPQDKYVTVINECAAA